MEDDTLEFSLYTTSQHSPLQPPSDDYSDGEEIEEDDNDDSKSELACPFCSEDFDLVGLYCHIDDEHLLEAKSGICPVCVENVGANITAHIITQHESILKALCKRKLCNGESRSALSSLRKELQDEHRRSFTKGSCHVVSSTDMTPDPWLLSFIYNPPLADDPKIIQASSSTEANSSEKIPDVNMLESCRNFHPSPLDKDQEAKAQRCEFIHGLLFSTILDDS